MNPMLVRWMGRHLQSAITDIPPSFVAVHKAANACTAAIEILEEETFALWESGVWSNFLGQPQELTDRQIAKLMLLNRQLRKVEHLIHAVAADATPDLEARKADIANPMCDYDIDCRIEYLRSTDDAQYSKGKSEALTERWESPQSLAVVRDGDFAESVLPARLRQEPHCYLFHDLYDHSPKVPFQDCLHIGKIGVAVQIAQQYVFGVPDLPACDTN